MTGAAAGGGPATSGSRPEPWGPAETLFLIDAYEERWRASRRGQLRAQQWEEVAAAVAARIGHPPGSPRAKSGTQCRHKLEKLRQRYRSEVSQSRPTTWPLFPRMHRLERGPLQPSSPPSSTSEEDDDDEKVNGAGEEVNGVGNWLIPRVSRSPRFFKKRPVEFDQDDDGGGGDGDEDEDEDDDDDDDDDDDNDDVEEEEGGVVGAVRGFGEGLMRLERRRMEVMRELERERMEMEARRTEMVVEASRCLAEAIAGAFSAAAQRAKRPRGP